MLDVHLPRPRTGELTTDPRFIEHKRAVLDAIKEESLKAIRLTSGTE
jgi:hypothetical protein